MDIHELLMKGLTGRNTLGLYKDAAKAGPLWKGADVDKRVHAMASEGLANRIGALPAMGIGVAKEIPTGIMAKLAGKPFFSEQGFDPQDIQANSLGVARATGLDRIAPFLARLNPNILQRLIQATGRRK